MSEIPPAWTRKPKKEKKPFIQIPEWLYKSGLKIKRWIASMLFLINLLMMFLTSIDVPILALMFLLNVWICKDYVWKTRDNPEVIIR